MLNSLLLGFLSSNLYCHLIGPTIGNNILEEGRWSSIGLRVEGVRQLQVERR